jgi:hypothetical protein
MIIFYFKEHHDLDDFMPDESAETLQSLEVQERFQGFLTSEQGTGTRAESKGFPSTWEWTFPRPGGYQPMTFGRKI